MAQGKKEPAKYVAIADALASAIGAGEYGPGDQLPSIRELMITFDTSKNTISQALEVLRSRGHVQLRQGAGAFVREPFAPILRHGIQRLARERWGSGASIWSTDEDRDLVVDQLTVTQDVPAPDRIAAMLSLAEGETVCVRDRRHVVAGRPVQLARSYMPQALVAGSQITQPDTGPGGTYARLSELGATPVHHREQLRYRSATREEAERLDLPASAPVIQLVRTTWAADQQPVEVNDMVLSADAYVLDYEFDAP